MWEEFLNVGWDSEVILGKGFDIGWYGITVVFLARPDPFLPGLLFSSRSHVFITYLDSRHDELVGSKWVGVMM